MTDIAGRIEELEVKAAESALIAELSADWEVRTYNSRLARELRVAAENLHARQAANTSDFWFRSCASRATANTCSGQGHIVGV